MRDLCRGAALDLRSIDGGLLVQQVDPVSVDRSSWRVVTDAQPDAALWDDIVFGWQVCAAVSSNAIVLAQGEKVVGVGAGLAIPRTVSSFILKQIEDTVRPLLTLVPGEGAAFSWNLLNPASSINVIIVLIGVSSVLFYFFFSVEHSGPGKTVARTGVMFLMIAFGAAFGYTVMARMSLLIGRLTDLIEYSDPSYGRPTLWLALVTIGTLIFLGRRAHGEPPDRH